MAARGAPSARARLSARPNPMGPAARCRERRGHGVGGGGCCAPLQSSRAAAADRAPACGAARDGAGEDRKSVVKGKRVDVGGRRMVEKKKGHIEMTTLGPQ